MANLQIASVIDVPDREEGPMIKEYRLEQIAKLVAVFKDTHGGELPATPEQLNEWVVKLARKSLDGKSPHEALNTFVQRLTAKDTYLLRQLALDLLQQVAASQTDANRNEGLWTKRVHVNATAKTKAAKFTF
jgi:hypothetical protein